MSAPEPARTGPPTPRLREGAASPAPGGSAPGSDVHRAALAGATSSGSSGTEVPSPEALRGDDVAVGGAGGARDHGRAFFLEGEPGEGRARLAAEDVHHALRVLRLDVGARLEVLDGRGRAWPARLARVDRGGGVEVDLIGPARVHPAPGEPGAVLPWIEVAVCAPKGGRAEELWDALTQLGAAALTPLIAERVQGPLRAPSPARLEKLARAAREACKQCRRLWLPESGAALAFDDWLAARGDALIVHLDPASEFELLEILASPALAARAAAAHRYRPLALCLGPEGGFSTRERAALSAAGAHAARLGPHLLRIETAAVAALAVAVQALEAARRRAG